MSITPLRKKRTSPPGADPDEDASPDERAAASPADRPRKSPTPPPAADAGASPPDDADDDGPGIFDTPEPSPWRPRAGGTVSSPKITFDVGGSEGRLTTHVLDTAEGRPASGMRVRLFRLLPQPGGGEAGREPLADLRTGDDGRTKRPLLQGGSLLAGPYELRFSVGDYYAAINHPHAWRFLDEVPIVFRVNEASGDYHVPLLVSPWSYSTYRGG